MAIVPDFIDWLPGAAHLYLLDYNDTHLHKLAESLRESFPSVKVSEIEPAPVVMR